MILSICKAEVSPFKPNWNIGDTWKMEFTERYMDQFSAAQKFIGGPKLGDFFEPVIYIFKVTAVEKIKDQECFKVEIYRKSSNKEILYMCVYYATDTLKIKLFENIAQGGTRLPHYVKQEGPILDFSISELLLSWPDFSQLDPANSPQMFKDVLQEVTVQGDTLTIKWKTNYNQQDNTYFSVWQQTWKKGNLWWDDMKTILQDGVIVSKANTVSLDTQPPDLSITVTPDTLWPPNNKMIKIIPQITVSDNQDPAPAPAVSLKSITSSEPDGDKDIQITQTGEIFLRASRDGEGRGRVYTIIYSATDASGNKTTSSVTVTVPHDQGQ